MAFNEVAIDERHERHTELRNPREKKEEKYTLANAKSSN